MLKKSLLLLTVILILAINIFRFINLENIPNGLQIDEQTSCVTLACLAQDGSSPLGDTHYPVFGYNSFATPIPPTYLYPGMLWVKSFGLSIGAVRALTVTGFTLALLGLFAIGRRLKGTPCGLWMMLAGSISPWTWTLSRIAWESLFMIPFLVWGLFFCLIARKYWHFIMAGILLSASAYSYPPARLEVPLAILLTMIFGFFSGRWKFSHIAALGTSFVVTSLPLIFMYLSSPTLAARFNELSITNPDFLARIGKTGTLPDIITIIFQNYLTFFTPDFLFFKGTPLNMTLTTGRQGIMSWLDILALITLIIMIITGIKKQLKPSTTTLLLGSYLILNFLAGILPAALISIDNPHPLRALGAWPFAMIATGLLIHKITENRIWVSWTTFMLSTGFAIVFLSQYFRQYPKESAGMFNIWTVTEARNAKTENDWMTFLYHYHHHMFTSRYFLMRYHGQSCSEARTTWEKLYPVFKNVYERNNPK